MSLKTSRKFAFPNVALGIASTLSGEHFAVAADQGMMILYLNERGTALPCKEICSSPALHKTAAPPIILQKFSELASRLSYAADLSHHLQVAEGDIVTIPDVGTYRVLSPNSKFQHLAHIGADVSLEVLPTDGVHDIRAFGGVGDYDNLKESPGKVAVKATDNFPAILAAAQAFEKHLKRGILAFTDGGDYWASNMPRFRVSDFTLWIAKGATIRTTTPTSFGTTIYAGQTGKTRNVKIMGGGSVRNYLPNLDTLMAWQPNTPVAAGSYVKTSANHAYWTRDGGITGATEPTVIAGSERDGAVDWRDALNENGISVHGEQVEVVGMIVPEASNKGITCQSPPWSNIWFEDNIVGRTHHDGIELKGNQGVAGQEALFGQRGAIINNVVEDAGRHGIHVQQPAAGTNKNRHVTIRDNTVLRNGYRHSDRRHTAFRINRCIEPVVFGNRAMDSSGNGFHFRKCDSIVGDVFVERCGIYGLHLQECDGFRFERISINGGSGKFAAIREMKARGFGSYGKVEVHGGNYTYAFEEIGRLGRVQASSVSFDAGELGEIRGAVPKIAS